jgi:hypothetical protein
MNNNPVKIVLRLWGFITLLLSVSVVHAESNLSDLVRQSKVEIEASLSNTDAVSVGQQVLVYVDIATDTWFTKGTVISPFDVDNAIVQLGSANVVNSSKRVKGQTYSTQRWEIPVYPMRSGRISIPSIDVQIQVKQDSGDVSGQLTTAPLLFSTVLPSPDMNDTNLWMVADSVMLEEQTNIVSDNEHEEILYVGDSVERIVTVTASGTSSMLIPTLLALEEGQTNDDEVKRIYISEPKRLDKANRGVSTAALEQGQTFVLQGPGTLTTPKVSLLWWEPENQTQKWLTLPAKTWVVKHTPASYFEANWPYLLAAAIFALGGVYGLIKAIGHVRMLNKTGRLPLWVQFQQAMARGDNAKAETVTYKKLLKKHGKLQFITGAEAPAWKEEALKVQKRYSALSEERDDKRTQTSRLRKLWRSVSGRFSLI